MSLSQSDIENSIEYLLFVEHEEDMANYTHLRPLIPELSKIVIQYSEKAVAEYKEAMLENIATSLRDSVADIVLSQHQTVVEDDVHDW